MAYVNHFLWFCNVYTIQNATIMLIKKNRHCSSMHRCRHAMHLNSFALKNLRHTRLTHVSLYFISRLTISGTANRVTIERRLKLRNHCFKSAVPLDPICSDYTRKNAAWRSFKPPEFLVQLDCRKILLSSLSCCKKEIFEPYDWTKEHRALRKTHLHFWECV